MAKVEIPKYSNPCQFDHLMLEPVHSMMETGIRIDQNEKKKLQEIALDNWTKYQEALDHVIGGHINVESKSGPKSVPQLLYHELGMPKRTRKKKLRADEEALRSIMAECKHKVETLKTESAQYKWMQGYIVCYYILKVRGIRKQISSYLGLKIAKGQLDGPTNFEDIDGRIRGTVSVGGAKTSRFSHSKTQWDTGANLATIPRETKSMYIADDMCELAEFDLNRGESWVYAHLSEDPELLRIHTEGLDFHAETAAAISTAFGNAIDVGWIVKHKDDEAYKIRYVGKRTNHATAYRMGHIKGAEVINEEAEYTKVTVTVAQVKEAQRIWHDKYFMIKNGWWNDIVHQLETSRTLTTPYGRILQFHDLWGQQLFKEATAYVPQSTSVDYLNRGFLKVYHMYEKVGAWGLKILAQTHDSILVQYLMKHRDEVIPSVIDALTSELTIKQRTFSIPVEASFGQSWGSLEGYH